MNDISPTATVTVADLAVSSYVNSMEEMGLATSLNIGNSDVNITKVDNSSDTKTASYTISFPNNTASQSNVTVTPFTVPSTGTSIFSSKNYIYTDSEPLRSNNKEYKDKLKELKEELESMFEDATNNTEELIKQIKKNPEGASIFNNSFQFWAGNKAALNDIIKRLNKKIEELN